MSLEGRLEDLNICSILQLISLGKKSGTLRLTQGVDQGTVSFQDGQVVRASSSRFPQGLGELLREHQLVTLEQVEEALNFQRRLRKHQPIGPILTYLFKLAAGEIEQVVSKQIEQIVVDFCRWQEGQFFFTLEPVAVYGSALVNPLDLFLERGLSPQRLALKVQLLESTDRSTLLNDDLLEEKLQELQQRQCRSRVDLLRGMLTELQYPDLGGGIILLILRYASELMRRAIILDVRGSKLVGLGQFGLPSNGGLADQMVRQLHLEVTADSLFFDAIRHRVMVRGSLKTSSSEQQLRTLLGVIPDDVLVAPLTSGGRVVALLYGDGLHQAPPSLAFDAFSVFLSQAGIAMEQALQSETEV